MEIPYFHYNIILQNLLWFKIHATIIVVYKSKNTIYLLSLEFNKTIKNIISK